MNFTLRIRLCLGIFALLVMLPVVAVPVLDAQTGVNGNGRILAGYWHDWETPVWIPLGSVPSSYDIIVVAFATYNGGGNFSFTVDPAETQAQFISDINYLHSQGKKVLISLGGASETPTMGSSSDAQNFATSAASIVRQFGFDGIDIDFENGAVYLNQNDTNINAPTTPSVVYLIAGLKQFHSALPNAMVTMAPIANYLQAGYQYYGPGPYGDSNWNGAYIPVIQAISGFLSYVWPQYYNECNIEALDNNLYCEGTDGNLVAMSEMLMKGFPVAFNAGNFTPLSQSKVLMGVPASPSASPGYLSNSDLEASFNYLITGKNKVGTYTLANPAGYPSTAGFMTWSINWDVYSNGGALGTGIHAYLASLPPVQGGSPPPPPPASFSLSDAPGSLSVAQGAAGSSTLTVSSSNGFNSAVSLSVSGLPAGVSAAFSAGSVTPPADGSATSTLTLTASGAAATGTATVTITAIGGGLTKTTTLSLTITGSSSSGEGPFGGTPAAIPGTVMAENYDTGGQGVGYNVTSINGTDNGYRSDGVDLETTSAPGGGNNIGWTAAGQWFRYTVNVATAGTYDITFEVASPAGVTDGFHLVDSAGTNLTGSVNIPATGGWQTWSTVTASVTLPAGRQVLTWNQDNAGYNLDSAAFASVSTGCTVPSAPTGLTATAASSSQINLSWTASSSTCSVTYNVFRSTTPGFTPSSSNEIASGVTATTYSNTGLTASTTYYYLVEGTNSGGTSAASNQANATTSASSSTSIFIDSGSTTAVSPFVADKDFTGGATIDHANIINTSKVTNPAPAAVYQTARVAATAGAGTTFSYTIPGFAAGSMHTVRLHFCETYWTAAGKRQFNVSINGTQVLTNFDIFATAGGQNIANIQQFTEAANASGDYVLTFTSDLDKALISGIEID
jgi:chitinase